MYEPKHAKPGPEVLPYFLRGVADLVTVIEDGSEEET